MFDGLLSITVFMPAAVAVLVALFARGEKADQQIRWIALGAAIGGGLGAVAARPLFAKEAGDSLVGKPLNEETIAAAAKLAQQVASPIDDMRGTAEFRTHLVGVLTRRTLKEAAVRARAR